MLTVTWLTYSNPAPPVKYFPENFQIIQRNKRKMIIRHQKCEFFFTSNHLFYLIAYKHKTYAGEA